MSRLRVVVVGVFVGLIVMLTMNWDVIRVKTSTKDPEEIARFRARRATGHKPSSVFGKCGGSSYGRFGWLASPNFPGSNYPALSSCNWTVSVYPRMVIRFDFVYMDMEDAPVQKRGSCLADYLMLREGPKPNDPLVGGQRFCGFDTPFNSVYSKTNKVWAYFASDGDIEGQGFAVRWTAVDPPSIQFNCDFESSNDICLGWQQASDDQFDWTTHHGLTQSGKTTDTGPTKDHTKNSAVGTYAYIEASGRRKGERAVLISPMVRLRNKIQCFKFWYHMRGDTMGTLNVYMREVIPDFNNGTVYHIFNKTGNFGDRWRRSFINVTSSQSRVQFFFEGIRGSSYRGDMAIDDISMSRSPCPTPVIRTTTTTTTTIATTTTKRPRLKRVKRPRPTPTKKPRRRTTTTTRPPRRITRPPTTTPPAKKCAGQYECLIVGNCIPLSYFCDGVPDCLQKEDEANCTTKAVTTTAVPLNAWNQWGPWSSCAVTCGGGSVERSRTCNNGKQDSFDECVGSSLEAMECNTQICLSWSNWKDWGSCSKSCDSGIQTRNRECIGGEQGQAGCIGPLIEVDFCNEHNCPKWGEWSSWSQCQATCGIGAMSRNRACEGGQIGIAGCEGNSTETKECVRPNTPPCPEWSDWDLFGQCSVSCGGGTKSRTRYCRQGDKKGEGCPGSSTDSEECNPQKCPEWANWAPWSRCSLSCGGGYHGRRRQCMLSGLITNGCAGTAIESGLCKEQPCPADPCELSPCQNGGSCITIRGAGGLPDYVCACPSGYKGKNCTEAAARVCYTGVSTRNAVQPSGALLLPTSCASSEDSCMIATVVTKVGSAVAYVDTAQCANGPICKTLKCNNLKKTMPNFDIKDCKIMCCDTDLCNTAPMELPVFTTTPYTTTKRPKTTKKPKTKAPRRTRKPRPKPTRPKTTKRPPRTTTPKTTTKPTPTTTVDTSGPHWSNWQNWQRCTHSCGPNGVKQRFRFCMKGAPGMVGCMPKDGMIEKEPCNTEKSCINWREWNNWQSCSRSCGGGKQERRRSCDGGAPNTGNCIGSDFEEQDCNKQSCDAPPTTTTTTTTTTTPTTTTTTTTTTAVAAKPKRARWDQWSEWDACSVTCGTGTQQRTRSCVGGRLGRRGCRGGAKQKQDCNNGECVTTTEATTTVTVATKKPKARWGDWSDWEACSVTCGQGTTKRTRDCMYGKAGRRGCRGKRNDKKSCEVGPCFVPETTTTAAPVAEVQCMVRDARSARRKGRRCPFECSEDSNCDDGEKCVCDGLCGKTCQDTSRKCINILSVEEDGTKVSCSNGVFVGSKCTFFCDYGYELKGGPDVYCQGTTKWTSQKKLPRCVSSGSVPKTAPTFIASTTTTLPTTPAQKCTFRNDVQDSCCGTTPYNSKKARCCNGKVRAAGAKMTDCCGTRAYNPEKAGCCSNNIYKKPNQKCEDGKVMKA